MSRISFVLLSFLSERLVASMSIQATTFSRIFLPLTQPSMGSITSTITARSQMVLAPRASSTASSKPFVPMLDLQLQPLEHSCRGSSETLILREISHNRVCLSIISEVYKNDSPSFGIHGIRHCLLAKREQYQIIYLSQSW